MAKNYSSTFKFSTTLSITLVLFMLCVFGWLTINLDNFSKRAKEEIQIDVFFASNISDFDTKKLEKMISMDERVKAVRYVTKEEAIKSLEEVGEKAVEILGYIPINPSLEVFLKSDYAVLDSVKVFEKELLEKHAAIVEDVSYSEAQFVTVNEGIAKVNYFILVLVIILLIITIVLINNTIRLSIYSKRFIIRTMQLVGAKGSFIRKPYLMEALYQGVLSSVLASVLFLSLGLVIMQVLPDLFVSSATKSLSDVLDQTFLLKEYKNSLILFGGIFLIGIAISFLTTYFALIKYLRIKSEKLYM
ncbi:MAG: cell division protein FtsX [Bacteroidia bacterium]